MLRRNAIWIQLPPELRKSLVVLGAYTGRSRTELITEAIELYLKKHDDLDAMGRLGSLEASVKALFSMVQPLIAAARPRATVESLFAAMERDEADHWYRPD